MKTSTHPTTDPAKKSLSRLLAAILLITGTLALLSATASFAFHIIVPIAALLALGILIARAVLHSLSGKTESLGSELRDFSRDTASEALKIACQSARSSVAVFRPNEDEPRENATKHR